MAAAVMAAGKPPAIAGGLPGQTVVLDDADALAREAARRIADAIRPKTEDVRVCLSGGSTPAGLYRLLAAMPDALPWDRIDWFFGDERLVPAGHPDSNARMAQETLFEPAGVPPERVHSIPTEGLDLAGAVAACETGLRILYGAHDLDPARPLFDVTLLGLGPDGHTASLFPGSPALNAEGSWAVGVAAAGQPPFVPRVSLTVEALVSSRLVLFLVGGTAKHAALRRIAAGEDLPAARVAAAAKAEVGAEIVWLLDRAASTGEAG